MVQGGSSVKNVFICRDFGKSVVDGLGYVLDYAWGVVGTTVDINRFVPRLNIRLIGFYYLGLR